MQKQPIRKLARKLGRRAVAWSFNAGHFDMERNGEERLLRELAKSDPFHNVFDIGMNGGAWSTRVLKYNPTAKIHGFEPIPEFAENCRKVLPGANVQVHSIAVADFCGPMTVYQAGAGGRSTDFPPTKKTVISHVVEALTCDEFVKRFKVDSLSFVKIDTDGADLKVIYGMGETLQSLRPLVQFEYSKFWIGSRVFLRDAYYYFEARGYQVGLINPRQVILKKYSTDMEIFSNMNFLAVPSERQFDWS